MIYCFGQMKNCLQNFPGEKKIYGLLNNAPIFHLFLLLSGCVYAKSPNDEKLDFVTSSNGQKYYKHIARQK